MTPMIADEFWKAETDDIVPETDAEKVARLLFELSQNLTEKKDLQTALAAAQKAEAYYRGETRALRSGVDAEIAQLQAAKEIARFDKTAHESPFIRQNNAIRKYVENQLAGKPGRDKLLIRFLAGILDIELRDQWVADRD